jgi:hypothetical protein
MTRKVTNSDDATLSLTLRYKTHWADEWFNFPLSRVHEDINKNRKNNSRRVRVAILDSGVDSTHVDFQVLISSNENEVNRSTRIKA